MRPLPVSAHPGHKGSERFLKLDLAGHPQRISYALVLSAEASREQRQRADGDGDGVVSAAEGKVASDMLGRQLVAALRICRGPSLARLVCSNASPAQLVHTSYGGWADDPKSLLALSWELRLELADDDVALSVEEAWPQQHVARTSAQIEPNPERPLVNAGAMNGPSDGLQLEFAWSEAELSGRPRKLFASWHPKYDLHLAWLAGGVIGTLLFALLLLRSRHSRRHANQPETS